METNRKKTLSTIVKIAISVFLLYFVFTKIKFADVWLVIQGVKWPFIVLSIVFFLGSQWVSAKRLLLFFKASGFYLSPKSNYALYLVGMFYNFFIPGGIGGDAYKIYKLNKKFKWGVKPLSASVFMDRFMGLTAIGVILSLMISELLPQAWEFLIIPLALLVVIGGSYLFTRVSFPRFKHIFLPGLLSSLLVQILQVGSVVCIIYGLDAPQNIVSYILVFLVSSVLSIFSFAGIGVREFVFYEASKMLFIDSSQAVTIGLLFSIITAFVSLFGIIYHFKTPELTLEEKEEKKD